MTPGLRLRAYQSADIAWLVRQRVAVLALEQGLGKTVEAIHAANLVQAENILVACPSIAKINWQREITKWSVRQRPVTVLRGRGAPKLSSGWVIVNYDVLSFPNCDLVKKLIRLKWDLLILDEGHQLKNASAMRTKVIYGPLTDARKGLASNSKRVWVLTGTPMPNHAGELWTHLHALAPAIIDNMSRAAFAGRYCELKLNEFSKQLEPFATREDMIGELRARIGPVFRRRTKREVLPELPPLQYEPYLIPPEDVDNHLLRNVLNREHRFKPGEIEAMIESGDFMFDTFLSTLRRMTGLLKAPVVARYALNRFAGSDEKVILFAHHRDVLDELQRQFREAGFGAVLVEGGMTEKAKQSAVDHFRENRNVRAFIGQIKAAGEAIDLSVASNVLMVEPSWVPADNAQAIARPHRLTQQRGVLVRIFTLLGSLDENINRVLIRKTRAISQLVDQLEDRTR